MEDDKLRGALGTAITQDTLLKRLQQMKENDLSQSVLVPLFRSFGYDEVEFHGGPDEQGKDLVCWGRDELGDIELGVVQTKRYRPTRRASDTGSFSEVVTQLSQCIETHVPYTDGMSYLPSAVYFVTPYKVDTRTLASRFAKVAALRQLRVKIIDGPKLAGLIRDRIPLVASSMLGTSDRISHAIAPQLSNQVLMNALGFQATRHIKEFYTDIDIAVGHVYARYFLCSRFHPKGQAFALDAGEWKSLRHVLGIIRSVFGVDLISMSSDRMDAQFARKKHKWEDWKEENRRLNASAQQLAVQISELREKIVTIGERTPAGSPEKKKDLVDVVSAAIKCIDSDHPDTGTPLKGESPFGEEIQNLLDVYRRLRVTYAKAATTAAAHGAKEPAVSVRIAANGETLADKLRRARGRIRDHARELQRKRRPTPGELKSFVCECQDMFSAASVVLRNPVVAKVVGLTPTDIPISEYTRLSFPIDLVFDTGLNVAVLGEAGAGKTTALQMYAFRHYESGDRDKLVIFAPLSQVVRFALTTTSTQPGQSLRCHLDAGLVAFLRSLGASYSLEEFHADAQRGGIILLDSIDEAFTYAPSVIESLVAFANKYPKLQLITSSRVSGEYAERIPFVGISLMPFTDEQQVQFISNWFGDDPKGHISTLCDHLRRHEDVADVVRNPLLATAMCALQEHNVPLPTSERRLYEEWLSLLVGAYDTHKKVSRLVSPRPHLELLAEKIAFYMQLKGKRDIKKDLLVDLASRLFDDVMDRTAAAKVLDELIHPCNILVTMTWTDELSFGHLRYQEYLTARELRGNRGIAIAPLVSSAWWKGVLVLFAQMHESLDWIVEELAEIPIDSVARDNLMAMIEAGPKRGRDELRAFVAEKASLDETIEKHLSTLL